MKEDLAFHAADYAYYYTEDAVGIGKRESISTLSKYISGPLLLPLIAYVVIKGGKPYKPAIQLPGPAKNPAMYAYARSQMHIWPYIKPVVFIMHKIVKQSDLDSDWFAMAQIPIMWLKKNDLLFTITKSRRSSITQAERKEFSLNRRKTYLVLCKDLARPWKGIDDLTYTEKCVFAVIVPHVFGQIKTSRLLNRWLSTIHTSYGDETSLEKKDSAYIKKLENKVKAEVDRIIEQYREAFETPYFDSADFDDPFDPLARVFEELDSEVQMENLGKEQIKKILLTHGYVKTVFFALIERSWEYGVLAPAELLWLKKVDRELFYVISQQGRISCFVDCSGCWSHYLYESACGFKILSPQVNEGIRAYDYDLFKTHNNYFPHEEWSNQAKWDKLVPDFGKKGTLPSPKATSATADVM